MILVDIGVEVVEGERTGLTCPLIVIFGCVMGSESYVGHLGGGEYLQKHSHTHI